MSSGQDMANDGGWGAQGCGELGGDTEVENKEYL